MGQASTRSRERAERQEEAREIQAGDEGSEKRVEARTEGAALWWEQERENALGRRTLHGGCYVGVEQKRGGGAEGEDTTATAQVRSESARRFVPRSPSLLLVRWPVPTRGGVLKRGARADSSFMFLQLQPAGGRIPRCH